LKASNGCLVRVMHGVMAVASGLQQLKDGGRCVLVQSWKK
jgi:hypothetical protein